MQLHFNADSQGPVMRVFFSFAGPERAPFSRGNFPSALGRKAECREPFLLLLFRRCLQLEIISMPKGHIWGGMF